MNKIITRCHSSRGEGFYTVEEAVPAKYKEWFISEGDICCILYFRDLSYENKLLLTKNIFSFIIDLITISAEATDIDAIGSLIKNHCERLRQHDFFQMDNSDQEVKLIATILKMIPNDNYRIYHLSTLCRFQYQISQNKEQLSPNAEKILEYIYRAFPRLFTEAISSFKTEYQSNAILQKLLKKFQVILDCGYFSVNEEVILELHLEIKSKIYSKIKQINPQSFNKSICQHLATELYRIAKYYSLNQYQIKLFKYFVIKTITEHNKQLDFHIEIDNKIIHEFMEDLSLQIPHLNSILNGVLLAYQVIGLEQILSRPCYCTLFDDLMIYSDFQLQQIKIKIKSKVGRNSLVSVLGLEKIDYTINPVQEICLSMENFYCFQGRFHQYFIDFAEWQDYFDSIKRYGILIEIDYPELDQSTEFPLLPMMKFQISCLANCGGFLGLSYNDLRKKQSVSGGVSFLVTIPLLLMCKKRIDTVIHMLLKAKTTNYCLINIEDGVVLSDEFLISFRHLLRKRLYLDVNKCSFQVKWEQHMIDLLNHNMIFYLLDNNIAKEFHDKIIKTTVHNSQIAIVFINEATARDFSNKYQTQQHQQYQTMSYVPIDVFVRKPIITETFLSKLNKNLSGNDLGAINIQQVVDLIGSDYYFYIKYFTKFVGAIKVIRVESLDHTEVCKTIYLESQDNVCSKDKITYLGKLLRQNIINTKAEGQKWMLVVGDKIEEVCNRLIYLHPTLDNSGGFNDNHIFVECITIIERLIFKLKTQEISSERFFIMLSFLLAQDFECCIDGVRGRLFTLESILRIDDSGLQSYSLEVLISDIVVSGLFATEFLKTMIGLDYKESASYFSYLQKLLLVKFNQEEKLELDYYLSQDVKKLVDQDIEENLDVFIEQQLPAILFRQAHSHLVKLCQNAISKENYLQLEYILSAFDLENKDIQRYYSNPEVLNLELSDLVFNDLVKKNYIRTVIVSNGMYQVSSAPQPPKSFFQLLGFSDLFEGVFPQ